ncbi:hypothetical protein SYNTR_0682 [Candidatus Syntrophocurvum alkaliphilum]|uniref:DUF366 domain-containing protein n=1 Tax=Candidatus Syntrophocurvum alkaliphilum TaxID=2293317 RepID=A0A6I6D8R3_9FIRM|nr:DUF366 family protein [Candidatus Syntrophocurvum alkaliphilum]QGT99275.1 hypothetical protein SYNTR_0682 [Candidatus Syntrophocurvum alkaliphilum]
MKKIFIDKIINYDGKQLQPQWIYRNYDLIGDAVVAFIGEANVPLGNMVDIADYKREAFIYSPQMLHFIIEHFNTDLELAVYRQRLFINCIKEELEQKGVTVVRFGDDLYINKRKLNVSIATSSILSTLIHVGINVETKGTPVKTSGLKELGISNLSSFAEKIMFRYTKELQEIYEARCKVRGLNN